MNIFRYRIIFPDALTAVGFLQLCFYHNLPFQRKDGIIYVAVPQESLKYFTDAVAFYRGSSDLITSIPQL